MDNSRDVQVEDATYNGIIILLVGGIIAYFGHNLAMSYGFGENIRLTVTVVSFFIGSILGYVFRNQIKLLILISVLFGFSYLLFWIYE